MNQEGSHLERRKSCEATERLSGTSIPDLRATVQTVERLSGTSRKDLRAIAKNSTCAQQAQAGPERKDAGGGVEPPLLEAEEFIPGTQNSEKRSAPRCPKTLRAPTEEECHPAEFTEETPPAGRQTLLGTVGSTVNSVEVAGLARRLVRRSRRERDRSRRRMVGKIPTPKPPPEPLESWSQPYFSSYFQPGSIAGRPVSYLIDTGCATNLIARRVFQRLPKVIKEAMVTLEDRGGVLADGSRIIFEGMVRLELKVRTEVFLTTLLIGNIREDVILGMPFLKEHACSLEFGEPYLIVKGRRLLCTDRLGRPLACGLQTHVDLEIPPCTEIMIPCRATILPAGCTGMVQGLEEKIPLARSVNTLNDRGETAVRCLNPEEVPLKIPSGTLIGTFQCLCQDDTIATVDEERAGDLKMMPNALKDLLARAPLQEAERKSAEVLMRRYTDVFSRDESDVGHTKMAIHEIPLKPGVRPIRQPPRRLGPTKDAEVERQVEGLRERGLIEPTDGAWSSPVVLVKKKDGAWRFCVDYRRLNDITCQDAFPLPRIDDSLDALSGNALFSTLDLVSGYWQVPLSPDAQEKSAFVTRSGLWK